MKRAKTSRTGKTFKVKDEEQKREIKRPGTRKRVKKIPEPRGAGVRIKPDLHKRPYGLLEGAGISADGLTPGQAWAAWDAYRRDVAAAKREAKSAPAKKQNPKAAKGKTAGTVRDMILHGTIEERERYMKTLPPADRAKMQRELDKQKQSPAKAAKPAKPARKTTSAASVPKRNVIGRTDKTLRIKLKRDFPFGKAGETFTVRKGDNGWTGNGYYWFSDFLRNGDLCEIVKREGRKDK